MADMVQNAGTGGRLTRMLRSLLLCLSLLFLCAFGGGTVVPYENSSPKGTYDVKVTMSAGPSEQWSSWSMDVSRKGEVLLKDYAFRPFYAWTCINHGRAAWLSDSCLHFHSYGAGQGRICSTSFHNATDKTIPYAEVWVRSVSADGYSHCPGIWLFFDIPAGEKRILNPGALAFAGGEYFAVSCEQNQSEVATARFRIPAATSTSSPYIPFRNQRVTVRFTDEGPVIEGRGGLEAVSEEQAKSLVPNAVNLPLVEERRRKPRS
jgi:hypothetical protein